jgi:hypothetical protein
VFSIASTTEDTGGSSGQWKIVRQRRSDCAITGDRIAGHKHLPEQVVDRATMSMRTALADAISTPRSGRVSRQPLAQVRRRTPVAHPHAVSRRSEAKQVIADGAGNYIARKSSSSQFDRYGVRKIAGAQRLHRGGSGSNVAVGITLRTTLNAARSTSGSERRSQQSAHNPDTEAVVGAAEGTKHR